MKRGVVILRRQAVYLIVFVMAEFPVEETAYRNIKRYFTEFRKEVEG